MSKIVFVLYILRIMTPPGIDKTIFSSITKIKFFFFDNVDQGNLLLAPL